MVKVQEKWQPISGYEGIYEVSSFGNVRSVDRVTNHKRIRERFLRGKAMKLYMVPDRYVLVTLTNGDKEKTLAVHRLVAKAFIPNPLGKITVNHKDGNKHNNNVENLEWATFSENSSHAIANGLATAPVLESGELHPASKLTNVDVEMIKCLKSAGFSYAQIGKRFGVSAGHCSLICRQKSRASHLA